MKPVVNWRVEYSVECGSCGFVNGPFSASMETLDGIRNLWIRFLCKECDAEGEHGVHPDSVWESKGCKVHFVSIEDLRHG